MWWARRSRYGDLVQRQIAIFVEEEAELLDAVEDARRAYERSRAGDAEERYGVYMDLVEEAEERLLELRDTYSEWMAVSERRRYEREFTRMAEKLLPSLVVRRDYGRAVDPDYDL
jgi:hypothetical protein